MTTSRSFRENGQPSGPRATAAGRKALQLTALCTSRPLPDAIIDEVDAPLTALLQAAETRIRAQVAERLADCSWAPREAVRWLAFGPLDIARPVLERSLRLSGADLAALADLDRDRRLALARRPHVATELVNAISRHREPECLETLARNFGADLTAAAVSDFSTAARSSEVLQDALAGRGDLSAGLARALYAIAGDAVRERLSSAFPDLSPARLADAGDVFVIDDRDDERVNRDAAERIEARGALTIADAMRAVENGRADIADHAIARLTGLEAADWRHGLRRSPLRASLLAARTMAMPADQARAFYDAMSEAGRAHAMPAERIRKAVDDLYGEFPRDRARRALHRMCVDGSIQ